MKKNIWFISVLLLSVLLLPCRTEDVGGSDEDEIHKNAQPGDEYGENKNSRADKIPDSVKNDTDENAALSESSTVDSTEHPSSPVSSEISIATSPTMGIPPIPTEAPTTEDSASTQNVSLGTTEPSAPSGSQETGSTEFSTTEVHTTTETIVTENTHTSTISISPSTVDQTGPESTTTTSANNTTASTEAPPISTLFTETPTKMAPTTTEEPIYPPNSDDGFATWAIVLIVIFVSFAIFFTFMYFLRKYLLRKRRADRQRLLGQSQEGFFMGGDFNSENANL